MWLSPTLENTLYGWNNEVCLFLNVASHFKGLWILRRHYYGSPVHWLSVL